MNLRKCGFLTQNLSFRRRVNNDQQKLENLSSQEAEQEKQTTGSLRERAKSLQVHLQITCNRWLWLKDACSPASLNSLSVGWSSIFLYI